MTCRLVFVIGCAIAGPARLPAQAAPAMPIAIEHRLADATHLHVGDTVRLIAVTGPQLARVSAIYDPHADPATIMRRDYHIRLHLPDLAALVGQPDRVDRIGIALRRGVSADTAAARLNLTAFGYDIFPSDSIAARSSVTFVVVSRFHRAIAIISILASTVFLLCLMLLKVEGRRRDVAVLRFIGISRRTVFVALMLEAALLALVGSAAGALLAAAASVGVNAYYQRAFATALVFSEYTAHTVELAVVLSVILGLAAGAAAAWRLVRAAPIELWARAA